MLRAFAEINEAGNKIAVHFKYNPEAVEAIREVPGRKFVGNASPKHWTVPLDLDSAHRLREAFGQGLELGDALKSWGRLEVRRQRGLAALTTAEDAELQNVRPESAAWLRPYQRADVKMMSIQSMGNFNQPGVGKTVETIFAIEEAGLKGPHIVVCPTSLFKDPWRDELAKHAPNARVMYGDDPAQRRGALNFVWMEWNEGNADDLWLLLNPEMIRVAKLPQETVSDYKGRILSRDHKGNAYAPKDENAERLFEIQWGAVVTDEFHKFGLGADRNTLFARGLKALGENAKRRYALSGTPMGGKTIRLWGVLNFINPEKYSSKWKWAELWLTNADGSGPVVAGEGTGIGEITPGREEEFNAAHATDFIRRNRADALPGLPDKVIIDKLVPMTKTQRRVYDEFVKRAEAQVDGGRVSANGALAEFARLKQFANARCELVDGVVQPTEDSGKLPVLLDQLDTYGIRPKDAEPGARAIVASESQRFVVLLESYLSDAGIPVMRLDGTVTNTARSAARDRVIDWYKEDAADARVLVMTTQTGGVGLNLGMTGSVHVLDETWNPDDQEQLEDRGMRNRTTPLTVVYYRTKDSIQEYIWETTHGKKITNKNVLELRNALRRK